MKIAAWMEQSGVAFGTSGARGLVRSMTASVCFAYTVGYLRHLATVGEFGTGMPVVVGGDLRPSTPDILRACVAAIRFMEGVPVNAGYVPTPALCAHAFSLGVPSLMVTGSHIPADRNGIKFNRARGEFLKADEAAMREQDVRLPDGWFDDVGALAIAVEMPPLTDIVPPYVARYRAVFGADALLGLRLGIYQHSAVGRDVLMRIVTALGGEAVALGRSATFIPVDTEAVRPEDYELARAWAANDRFDAILTTDGDSDRPLLADQTGVWIRGDVLGILCARFLKAESVATPVSSNTALEKAGFAKTVRRTRIGSPFVVAAMTQSVAEGVVPSVGYEANGGFLLASDVDLDGGTLAALPTRDAVLPMLCALVGARQAGLDLASFVRTLPPRFTLSDRIENLPTDRSQARIAALARDPAAGADALGLVAACGPLAHVDQTDGLRMTFAEGEIVHLRPSGNAPELRLYVEAASPARAAELLGVVTACVRPWKDA